MRCRAESVRYVRFVFFVADRSSAVCARHAPLSANDRRVLRPDEQLRQLDVTASASPPPPPPPACKQHGDKHVEQRRAQQQQQQQCMHQRPRAPLLPQRVRQATTAPVRHAARRLPTPGRHRSARHGLQQQQQHQRTQGAHAALRVLRQTRAADQQPARSAAVLRTSARASSTRPDQGSHDGRQWNCNCWCCW